MVGKEKTFWLVFFIWCLGGISQAWPFSNVPLGFFGAPKSVSVTAREAQRSSKDGVSDKKIESLDPSKEIESLQENLDKLKKNIITLEQKFNDNKEEGELKSRSFVKTYVSIFVKMLEERMAELYKGVKELWLNILDILKWHISRPAWVTVSIVFISFSLTTLLGVCVGIGVYKWIGKGLSGIFKWTLSELKDRPKAHKVTALTLDAFAVILPVFAFSFTQVSSFFFIESMVPLRNAMSSFASGIFIWVSVWRLLELILKNTPSDFFAPGAQRQKNAIVRYVRWLLLFWILKDWILEFFGFIHFSYEAGVVVTLILGLGMVITAFGLIHTFKRPLFRWVKNTQEKQFPLLTTVFWLFWNSFPAVLYLLFFVDDLLFYRFCMPVVFTTILLPLIPVIYGYFKTIRVFYLWRHRHDSHKGFFNRLLRPRARAYRLFYILTYGVVGSIIVELWDLRFFQYLKFVVGTHIYDQLADIVLLILGAWVMIHFGDRALKSYWDNRYARVREEEAFFIKGRMRTVLMMLRTVLRITVFVVLSLTILSSLGYNIAPLITNLAIFSAVLSFGMQSFVKDFVAGLFILLDNNVMVGDWVDIDGKLGITEELTLRTIKVRADSGTLMTIPFGNIKVIGNRSRFFSCAMVNLPAPYDVDPQKVQDVMESAYQELKKIATYRKKLLGPIEVRGINDINDYAMVFQARIKTNPAEQEFVRRGYNKQLKIALDKAAIRIPHSPYPQLSNKILSVSGKMSKP